MGNGLPFAEVLEAVDQLSADDQEALIEIVRRRALERSRRRLVEEAQEAQREFADGGCRKVTSEELIDEILA
jgi:hypothetical protein